jgi:hypothetical protein
MAAFYEQRVRFDADPDDVLDAFADALDERRAIDVYLSRKRRRVTARTRLNVWCWRERIEIVVRDGGEVTARSRCVIPTQIHDYGKNRQNVKELIGDVAVTIGDGSRRRADVSAVDESASTVGPVESKLSRSGKIVLYTLAFALAVLWLVLITQEIGPGRAILQEFGGRRKLSYVLVTVASVVVIALPLAFLWDLVTGRGLFARGADGEGEDG